MSKKNLKHCIINENMQYDIKPENDNNSSFLKLMILKEYSDETCAMVDELMKLSDGDDFEQHL